MRKKPSFEQLIKFADGFSGFDSVVVDDEIVVLEVVVVIGTSVLTVVSRVVIVSSLVVESFIGRIVIVVVVESSEIVESGSSKGIDVVVGSTFIHRVNFLSPAHVYRKDWNDIRIDFESSSI